MNAFCEDNKKKLVPCLLEMGDLLLDCGAEISRVEDTLQRVGQAYGAVRIDVFAIPSLIVLNAVFPDQSVETQSRRIRSNGSIDFYRLEKLNAVSRRCCADPMPIGELEEALRKVSAGQKPGWRFLLGSMIGAGAFAVFFGGTVWDGLGATAAALFICFLQKALGRTELNQVAANLLISLTAGLLVGGLTVLFPVLHMDMILIGDIMLLIPGLAMTNAIRNMLIGDTVSGVVRLAESLIWAIALAGGFMVAMLLLQRLGVAA